jgi:hypothetical protein
MWEWSAWVFLRRWGLTRYGGTANQEAGGVDSEKGGVRREE